MDDSGRIALEEQGEEDAPPTTRGRLIPRVRARAALLIKNAERVLNPSWAATSRDLLIRSISENHDGDVSVIERSLVRRARARGILGAPRRRHPKRF
jgi:hypothetical protein